MRPFVLVLLCAVLGAGTWFIVRGRVPGFAGSVSKAAKGLRTVTPHLEPAPLLVSELQTQGGRLKASYELQNVSDRPKMLTFEGASCGCSEVCIDGRRAKAGDQVWLAGGAKASVELDNRIPFRAGQDVLSAWLTPGTNARADDRITLSCRVRVLADLSFRPTTLCHEFKPGEVDASEKTVFVETIVRAPEPGLHQIRVNNLPGHAEVAKITRSAISLAAEPDLWKQSWQVTFKIQASEELHAVPAPRSICFTIDDPGRTRPVSADLPVIIRRIHGVEAPEYVHFGMVNRGESRKKRMLIRSGDGTEFKLLRIETSSTAFAAAAGTSKAAKRHWVEATFEASQSGPADARIIIETDHPQCPVVTVAASADVEGPP